MSNTPLRPLPITPQLYTIGDQVEVRRSNGNWQQAKIIEINGVAKFFLCEFNDNNNVCTKEISYAHASELIRKKNVDNPTIPTGVATTATTATTMTMKTVVEGPKLPSRNKSQTITVSSRNKSQTITVARSPPPLPPRRENDTARRSPSDGNSPSGSRNSSLTRSSTHNSATGSRNNTTPDHQKRSSSATRAEIIGPNNRIQRPGGLRKGSGSPGRYRSRSNGRSSTLRKTNVKTSLRKASVGPLPRKGKKSNIETLHAAITEVSINEMQEIISEHSRIHNAELRRLNVMHQEAIHKLTTSLTQKGEEAKVLRDTVEKEVARLEAINFKALEKKQIQAIHQSVITNLNATRVTAWSCPTCGYTNHGDSSNSCEMCAIRNLATGKSSNGFVRISFPKSIGGGFLTLRVDAYASVEMIKEQALATRKRYAISTNDLKHQKFELLDFKKVALSNDCIPEKGLAKEPSIFELINIDQYKRFRSTTVDLDSHGHQKVQKAVSGRGERKPSFIAKPPAAVRVKYAVGTAVEVKRSSGKWQLGKVMQINLVQQHYLIRFMTREYVMTKEIPFSQSGDLLRRSKKRTSTIVLTKEEFLASSTKTQTKEESGPPLPARRKATPTTDTSCDNN